MSRSNNEGRTEDRVADCRSLCTLVTGVCQHSKRLIIEHLPVTSPRSPLSAPLSRALSTHHIIKTMKKMCSSNASYAAIMKMLLSTTTIMMLAAACSMILFSTTPAVSAFSTPYHQLNNHAPHPTISSIQLMATSSTINDDTPTPNSNTANTNANNNANEKMRQLGNSIILSAAKFHGATDEMVTIDWRGDRIVVTVDVDKQGDDNSMSGAVLGELEEDFDDIDDEFEEFDEEELFEEYEDDYTEDDFDEEEDFEALQAQLGIQPEDSSPSTKQKKIDLTLIARTINEYLSADGENTPQFKIAQLHEIEVTTPEFDNVLRSNQNGVDMFEVYKGFDVIVDYWEVPKKKKKKKKSGKADKEEIVQAQAAAATEQQQQQQQQQHEEESEEPKRTQKIIEGKLVGRDYEKDVTMINVKGRIVKIKNEMIESVMLPKAKREKGVK
jgi:hypothetical protein